MKILKKNPDKDFVILNLTDPQLDEAEWGEGHPHRKILEYTIAQLVERTNPDLITISGDLAWAGCDRAYEMLAELLEKYQIPWTMVWGNHDNQNGAEYIERIVTKYMQYPHCIYERGDSALGNGNYVIGVEENGRIVEALIMLDSHDKNDYVDKDGKQTQVWAKLTSLQLDWYRQQIRELKEKNCASATMIVHIPIHAYATASRMAYKSCVEQKELTITQSEGTECWNAGYEDSVGVQYENISCYPEDDGVFAVIKEEGLTKRVIAGHDHVNNFMISYDGIQLIFALKLGAGCYWDKRLNGGTVLKVGKNGVYEVRHEYVDVSHI